MTNDTIRDGLVVSLAYTLTADGETIETSTSEEPLDYLHGAENIVPGLEAALNGKRVGDQFKVTLQPADAYGDYDDDDVETIPLSDLPDAETLEEGMVVVMEDEEGYLFDAIIREIGKETVVLDFNPPLAGKTITYDVQVLAMREAEEEEIAAGQPYGFDDFDDDDYEEEDEE
ncbi:MAG: FKBP-type peptidyl-prolyl cis-trans isomerase [Anaerolineae bacterium]|nr:FKBP-type peptidyl-prolyl cis-trans isomerase [Anaerolineae bacterium]